ncbi:MAG TPA: transcriptional regulator NrdR [Actinomycetota bacterium]|nr:transcriptional regulator NrdR [Actinomycetota bacterium]
MRCRFCGAGDTRVVDSRAAEDGRSIRRRRACAACGRRFTTYERVDGAGLTVVKLDGRKEPYDRAKLVSGVMKAIKNRPVDETRVSRLVDEVERRLERKGPVVTTQEVGVEVLDQLRKLDEIAYIRFASVYKDFQELTDFERELGLLLQKRSPAEG